MIEKNASFSTYDNVAKAMVRRTIRYAKRTY